VSPSLWLFNGRDLQCFWFIWLADWQTGIYELMHCELLYFVSGKLFIFYMSAFIALTVGWAAGRASAP